MKIIVDAMGGDNAPACNVKGALDAVKELGVEVVLVCLLYTSDAADEL